MAGSVDSGDGDIGFQIAPMVDVVFVLMLFFMACAGAQQVELYLGINLPAGESSKGPTVTPIIVDIGPEGTVSVNSDVKGKPADKGLQSLVDFLTNARETFGDKDPVIIRPSPDALHERIMDVLNAASRAKVTNLTFS